MPEEKTRVNIVAVRRFKIPNSFTFDRPKAVDMMFFSLVLVRYI